MGVRTVRAPDIDPEELDWIRSYESEVVKVFEGEFSSAGPRFEGSRKLLQRFEAAINTMLSSGRSFISAVDEAHNEMCVASRLLANSNPLITLLEYEPILSARAKSIDFRAHTDEGQTVYVDVKTIQPQPKDRWDQFERADREGWFPENVNVRLSKKWLGGELWHNMFATRSRMLEYTLELEGKIRDRKLMADDTFFILALCGNGFHWHQDALEDFVASYRSGSYRADDHLSKVEAKHIAEKNIKLDKTITRFACMTRPQFEIHPRRLNWNVQPPRSPAF